ncbi:MAG: nuclear transport factor 2 family protein, partial [Gaiellales bacterium]
RLMPVDNIEQVKRGYSAFKNRDLDELVAVTHPEVEFTSLVRESEGEVYRGHEGMREFFKSLIEVLPDWKPEIDTIEDHGDRMLVKARIHASPPGGDVPLEQVAWQAIRLRDGLAIRWDFFRTEEEARAALADD